MQENNLIGRPPRRPAVTRWPTADVYVMYFPVLRWAERDFEPIIKLLPGDLSHLASLFILLHKIQTSRSCRGMCWDSRRKRHTDGVPARHRHLLQNTTWSSLCARLRNALHELVCGEWISLYNTIMKLFFIGSSCYVLYLMKVRYKCVPSNML